MNRLVTAVLSLAAIVVASLLSSRALGSEWVEQRFTGEVLSVNDALGLFEGGFSPGSPASGYYYFEPEDMTVVPSQPPDTGMYVAGGNAPSPLGLTLGDTTFEPFFDSFLRVRLIDGGIGGEDSCLVGSPTRFPFEYPPERDLLFPDVALTWTDPAGAALSSVDLEAVEYAADYFPQRFGRVVVRDADTHAVVAEATFSLDPESVPEPAGPAIVAVAAALVLRGPRPAAPSPTRRATSR